MIVGIGGAGCSMVETISREASVNWVLQASYLFANTDQPRLTELSRKGYQTVDLTDSEISKADFRGVEKLYVLAGLGARTGSTYIIKAIKVAQATGVRDISAIVTFPFSFEGEGKAAIAKDVIGKLSDIPTKVLYNDDLLELENINFADVFLCSDLMALKAIESGEPK